MSDAAGNRARPSAPFYGGVPHTGLSSVPSVTWTRSLPSALTIQMLSFEPPGSERVKTICVAVWRPARPVAAELSGLTDRTAAARTDRQVARRAAVGGRAEDVLFEWADVCEPDARERLLPVGKAFYERLLELSDPELEQGNLPRSELESGRKEWLHHFV